MARLTFIVSLEAPPDASRQAVKDYILAALSSWNGSLRPPASYDDNDPGDPMFSLDTDTIEVQNG